MLFCVAIASVANGLRVQYESSFSTLVRDCALGLPVSVSWIYFSLVCPKCIFSIAVLACNLVFIPKSSSASYQALYLAWCFPLIQTVALCNLLRLAPSLRGVHYVITSRKSTELGYYKYPCAGVAPLPVTILRTAYEQYLRYMRLLAKCS